MRTPTRRRTQCRWQRAPAELHLKLVPSLQFIAALLGEPPPQQIDVSISRCCPKLNRRPALATARLKLGTSYQSSYH